MPLFKIINQSKFTQSVQCTINGQPDSVSLPPGAKVVITADSIVARDTLKDRQIAVLEEAVIKPVVSVAVANVVQGLTTPVETTEVVEHEIPVEKQTFSSPPKFANKETK